MSRDKCVRQEIQGQDLRVSGSPESNGGPVWRLAGGPGGWRWGEEIFERIFSGTQVDPALVFSKGLHRI